jgi:hypothetical protein
MKTVDLLIEDKLLEHVDKIAQIVSILAGKKVTVGDVIEKSIKDYTKYGESLIKVENNSQKGLNFNIYKTTESKEKENNPPLNHELFHKLCAEEW